MVNVYYINCNSLNLNTIDLLHDNQKNHVLKNKTINGQQETLGSILLLNKYLNYEYEYINNEIPSCKNKYISVTHKNSYVFVAISDNPIGIDLELVGKNRKAFDKLIGVTHKEKYIEWTKNEAYYKRTNEGSIFNPEYMNKGYYFTKEFTFDNLEYVFTVSLNDNDKVLIEEGVL